VGDGGARWLRTNGKPCDCQLYRKAAAARWEVLLPTARARSSMPTAMEYSALTASPRSTLLLTHYQRIHATNASSYSLIDLYAPCSLAGVFSGGAWRPY
jgi:hypothetical protein